MSIFFRITLPFLVFVFFSSLFPMDTGSQAVAEKYREGPKIVLLDQGHGQRFSFDRDSKLDLSFFRKEIEGAGAITRINRGRFTQKGLEGVSSVVISGAFSPLSHSEIKALVDFVTRGGRIAVLLHIGFPVYGLLDRFGISVSNGVIRERENVLGSEGLDFTVKNLAQNDLFKGLDSFNVYGCWALLPRGKGMESLAQTSRRAWVDLNNNKTLERGDAVQSFSVMVLGHFGQGEILVIGDDAVFQNVFLKGGNLKLSRRVARWLLKNHVRGVGSKAPKIQSSDFI